MNKTQVNLSQELSLQGWIRQFTIETNRAGEYIHLYESLGNEVKVVPMTPDLLPSEECSTCLLTECDKFVIIFTRPRVNG